MAVTFRYRRDISSEWNNPKYNAVLKTGEPAIELDTGRMKVALGTSYNDNSLKKWSETPYLGPLVNNSLEYNNNMREFLGIAGFDTADSNTVPMKTEDGVLTWITPVTSSAIENTIVESDLINNIINNKIVNQINNIPLLIYKGEAASVTIDDDVNTYILYDNNNNPIVSNPGEVYMVENREFMRTNSGWIELGNELALSNLATKTEINNLRDIVNQIQSSNENGVLTMASQSSAGIVRGSTASNQISVDVNGYMNINTVGIDKLVNVDGVELILNGGYDQISNT